MKRRLRLLAARRDISMRQYLLEAIEWQIAEDWAKLTEQGDLLVLHSLVDPVLAELWDNERDTDYDWL
jgi:hypothetical protein